MALVSFSFKTGIMISIFIFFFSLPPLVFSAFSKLQLPPRATAPEAIAFDVLGGGPYTGVTDGRVLKYGGRDVGFQDFSFSTPNRSKAVCDGTTDPNMGPVCGRPLGLGFNISNHLYVADAYFGLLAVGTRGGLGTQLATGAEGVPFRFPNALDVYRLTGYVYFTDFSSVYQLRNVDLAIARRDATGRLLRYNPNTRSVTVLQRGLSGPAGVAVSFDGSYLLVSEFIAKRVQKFWLTGPRANTAEIITTFQGNPDNVKRNGLRDFWVAVNVKTGPTQTNVPTAIRINASGAILERIPLTAEYNSTTISEVQQFLGRRYIGSYATDFVGVYNLI